MRRCFERTVKNLRRGFLFPSADTDEDLPLDEATRPPPIRPVRKSSASWRGPLLLDASRPPPRPRCHGRLVRRRREQHPRPDCRTASRDALRYSAARWPRRRAKVGPLLRRGQHLAATQSTTKWSRRTSPSSARISTATTSASAPSSTRTATARAVVLFDESRKLADDVRVSPPPGGPRSAKRKRQTRVPRRRQPSRGPGSIPGSDL